MVVISVVMYGLFFDDVKNHGEDVLLGSGVQASPR
jgi:hypothetical protein